jgi:hypothetical protein
MRGPSGVGPWAGKHRGEVQPHRGACRQIVLEGERTGGSATGLSGSSVADTGSGSRAAAAAAASAATAAAAVAGAAAT